MLEIKNVTKIFDVTGQAEDKKTALDNVSITINDGDFVTIIGGNGSGKTTLMNIIAGAFPPTDGQILIDGEDVTKQPEYKRAKYLGRVFQDPMLGTAGNMSIVENMELAMKRDESKTLKWGFKKEHLDIFKKQLTRLHLGLEDRMNQKVGLLSGGQRQAVTLLMATLKKPKLLLLDEHTAALDPKTARKVLNLTDEIVREEQLTTIMITHNMKDAIKYGNRIIMMYDGKVIFDLSGEEKKNLTVEYLLNKFDEMDENSIDDDAPIE